MLENDRNESDLRERRRLLIGLTAIATVIVSLLILLFVGLEERKPTGVEGILGAGNAEFDAYREKVQVEMLETIVHPNLIGMAQHEVRGQITNNGDRRLTAIEIHGRMIGLDEGTVAEASGYPIPRSRETALTPGESFSFSIKIDRPGNVKEESVKDHSLELRGLRF